MANKINPSKILSQNTAFKSKYFHVDRVDLEINGKKITKDIIIRNPVVLILPLTENNEIYLVSQYRDALKKTTIEVIAGTMDINEDPLKAAKRELQEETGLTADSWKFVKTMFVSSNMTADIHLFIARKLHTGIQNTDEDETINVHRFPLDEAIKMAIDGEIETASHIASILLLDKLK